MAKRGLSWPQVINNFLLRLTSTGQLPFVAMILLLAFMVYRTPPSNIAQVWTLLADMLDRHGALGYSLCGLAGGGWITHARYQRRKFDTEISRIVEERNQAQQALFSKKLKSTK